MVVGPEEEEEKNILDISWIFCPLRANHLISSLALARALHLPVATFWGFAHQGGEVGLDISN